MAWDQAQDGWGQTGSSGAGTTTTGAVLEVLRYELDEGSGSFISGTATTAEASGGTSMVLTPVNTGGMTDINLGGVGINIEGVSGNFPNPPGASFVPDDLFADALNLATDELLVGVEVLSAAPSVATQGVYLVAYQSGALGSNHVSSGAIYDGAIKRGLYDVYPGGNQDVKTAGAMKSWLWLHLNDSTIRNLISDAELTNPFDSAATVVQTRSTINQDPTYSRSWTGPNLRIAIVGLTTGTTHDIQIGTIVVQRIRHDAAVV